MAFSIVVVSHTFQNDDGTPADGMVMIQLSEPMTNGGVTRETTPHTFLLDSTGSFSVHLAANDDPTTEPQNTYYTVVERVTATSNREYTLVVPCDAPHGVLDLEAGMPEGPQVIG
jgi:hypothetical protein